MQNFEKKHFDVIAEENETCRKIVSEIMRFGVNQRQILFIVNLLALNLNDQEQMREIVGCVKSFEVSDLCLSDVGEQQ